MNILCFIDNLGSGGAQRQLVALAIGLKKRGHIVRFLVYHREDHFLPLLEAAQIPHQLISPSGKWNRLIAVRHILSQGWQDVVLAFLEGPCLYAELARMPWRRWGLVAGERSANPKIKCRLNQWLRQFHRYADVIVTNSHTNRLLLDSECPYLRGKIVTIYNVVDLQLFHPGSVSVSRTRNHNSFQCRIVVAASYQELKNMMGLARAMIEIKKTRQSKEIVIDWFGEMATDQAPFHQAARFIAENGLTKDFRLHPPSETIEKEFVCASAVGLFSFYEGLPNAICEGMACGKPILMSNICDAGNLVHDGKNGFLCDPNSPESIANALRRLAELTEPERMQLGMESRRIAEQLFIENVVIERYERILIASARHESLSTDVTWPEAIPASAFRTVEHWLDIRKSRRV